MKCKKNTNLGLLNIFMNEDMKITQNIDLINLYENNNQDLSKN